MKTLTTSLLVMTMGCFLSQNIVVVNRDSTESKPSSNLGKAIEKLLHKDEEGKSEAHWAGIDFGFSILFNKKYNRYFSDSVLFLENTPSSSVVVNLNPFEYKLNFGTPYVGLTTGLGFSFKILSIPDNYRLVHPISSDNLEAFVDTIRVYKRNNLFNAFITVPLMFEINSHKSEYKSFYFAFGVLGSARIGTYYKRVGVFQGARFKFKESYKFSVNSFLIDGLFRLGYKNVGVFFQLGLTSFFKKSRAPQTRLFSFGLSLNL